MANQLDGFYVAEYEGVNEAGTAGRGVAVVRNGKIHGGDSHSCFVGTLQEVHGVIAANVSVYPLTPDGYQSIAGYESAPWVLPDIRGKVPPGDLPLDVVLELDGQRYDESHAAIMIRLTRILVI
jgi:hypothetical protein